MRDILVEGLLVKPDGKQVRFYRRYKLAKSARQMAAKLASKGYYVVESLVF